MITTISAASALSNNIIRHRNIYPWNVIIAADVLGYINDIHELFSNIYNLLNITTQKNTHSYFLFTTEDININSIKDYHLSLEGRYSHNINYIKYLANLLHFNIELCKPVILRTQNMIPVNGHVWVLSIKK